MKRLFPALVLLSAACSQDGTGPRFASVGDLAGRWNLASLVLVGVPDSSKRLDLIARFGLSATLSISPGGRAVITAILQGNESADTAALTLHADTLTYTSTRAYSYSVAYILRGSGKIMTWTAVQTNDFFDLDGDGTPDVAREIDTWQRF